ncbi:NAD(P)H-dependent amine dehydrogenase family protein [Thermaurantiacus sp.]
MARLRVAVWGAGNVGCRAIRMIAARPDMELVALHVRAGAKTGQDAGALAGIGPIGVPATSDPGALLAARPDVLLHAPLPAQMVEGRRDSDDATLVALLEAGINVVTTVGYVWPHAYGPQVAARLQAAGEAGGASLHGTGLNPGFQGDVLALVLARLTSAIRGITISEATVFDRYPSAEVVFGLMGMGLPPQAFAARTAGYRAWLTDLFRESLMLLGAGLGEEVTEVADEVETALTDTEVTIAAGTLAAGTIGAQRWRWSAQAGPVALVHETLWRAAAGIASHWPAGENMVGIEGDPAIRLPLAAGWTADGLAATAAHAVNAMPAVVAGRPGILTALDLPLALGSGSVPYQNRM